MLEKSGRSASEVSRSIGKSRNYIGGIFAQGSDIRTSNLARVAHELGYRLVLKGDDEEIELYDERDAQSYVVKKLSGLQGSVRVEDVINVLDDPQAAYDSGNPARVLFPVTLVDEHGGQRVVEVPADKDMLRQIMQWIGKDTVSIEVITPGTTAPHDNSVEDGSESGHDSDPHDS